MVRNIASSSCLVLSCCSHPLLILFTFQLTNMFDGKNGSFLSQEIMTKERSWIEIVITVSSSQEEETNV